MPKSLMQLREPHCRFPLNDTLPYTFCARDAMPGEPYCPEHQELCYGRAAPRVRRVVSPVGFEQVLREDSRTAPSPAELPARPAADLVQYAQEPHAWAVPNDVSDAESDLQRT